MDIFARRIALMMILMLSLACGRPPADKPGAAEEQKLPFDRRSSTTGISPSRTLIPSTTKLPEGTPIVVRLSKALSSASAHSGEAFNASLDEDVAIDGRTLLAKGTPAWGRVLEVRPAASTSAGLADPGYVRIVLEKLDLDGKTIEIETSSIFAKGGSRDDHVPAGSSAAQKDSKDKDIVFGVDRRLNFRLAQTVDLQ